VLIKKKEKDCKWEDELGVKRVRRFTDFPFRENTIKLQVLVYIFSLIGRSFYNTK